MHLHRYYLVPLYFRCHASSLHSNHLVFSMKLLTFAIPLWIANTTQQLPDRFLVFHDELFTEVSFLRKSRNSKIYFYLFPASSCGIYCHKADPFYVSISLYIPYLSSCWARSDSLAHLWLWISICFEGFFIAEKASLVWHPARVNNAAWLSVDLFSICTRSYLIKTIPLQVNPLGSV